MFNAMLIRIEKDISPQKREYYLNNFFHFNMKHVQQIDLDKESKEFIEKRKDKHSIGTYSSRNSFIEKIIRDNGEIGSYVYLISGDKLDFINYYVIRVYRLSENGFTLVYDRLL